MRVRVSIVAAGRRHSVGCMTDGTVVAAGHDGAGECQVMPWRDVVAVAAGLHPHPRPACGRLGGQRGAERGPPVRCRFLVGVHLHGGRQAAATRSRAIS
jgi:hypothetical protein